MRALVYIFVAVAVTSVIGIVICRAAGFNPHFHELSISAGAVLAASVAGTIPLMLSRGGPQISIVYAALIGTVIQMLGSLSFGLAATVLKFGAPQPLLGWLLVFYWTSLAALVAALIRAIHLARDGSIAPSK